MRGGGAPFVRPLNGDGAVEPSKNIIKEGQVKRITDYYYKERK